MKKVISIIIALMLVMSSSLAFAGNDKGNQGKGKGNNKYYSKIDYSKKLEKLKDLMEKYYNDEEKREDILKDILNLKDEYDDESTSIFINGVEYSLNDDSIIQYRKFRLPTKVITDGMGAKINWNPKTKIVTITKGNIAIVMRLDKKSIAVNGIEAKSNLLKNLKKGEPTRLIELIAQVIGYKAEIDENSNTVIVDNDDRISINDSVVGKGLNQFDFKGRWIYTFKRGAFLDDVHYSTNKNSYFNVRFSGTRIKLYGSKSISYGIAAVSIDGGPEKLVDLYSTKRSDDVLVYTSPMLSNAEHTLKVRVTGTKNKKSKNYPVVVDRVEVLEDRNVSESGNLALNKNAFSDSVQTGNTASKGNDGNMSTRWCAADGAANHWWTVDLGGYHNVSGNEVTWGKNSKIYKYKVEVSQDNSNWTLKVDKTNNTSTKQVQTDSFSANAVRFVRITVTGLESDAWASFYEFKVFGYAALA